MNFLWICFISIVFDLWTAGGWESAISGQNLQIPSKRSWSRRGAWPQCCSNWELRSGDYRPVAVDSKAIVLFSKLSRNLKQLTRTRKFSSRVESFVNTRTVTFLVCSLEICGLNPLDSNHKTFYHCKMLMVIQIFIFCFCPYYHPAFAATFIMRIAFWFGVSEKRFAAAFLQACCFARHFFKALWGL